ncbi:methylated-DNA--[protein]-cysteine S-methyltransferase [Ruegeria marina]|uniref:Methylated-DNA-[protein]-cysteine S-methyltransferase n=1 Tax=Ruegeria marina TaxID=639004 RepID=A0A1G6THP6_9RHOB|nr:methylated-DNA--[protein]-cysteine S-methyltransferase [Ruegeria marina]SDD28571.1 methylated-DNA-[protein]-cysteine S-methyltransferase [Ruegeria marina]
MPSLTVDTPTGPFVLTEEKGAITRATWGRGGADHTPLLDRAAAQLEEYFRGARKSFDLPLHLRGSPLQRAVCAAIIAIPYGDTLTYGEIARDLGSSAQAVGQCCGGNPIPILIPCHRVLGVRGLTGFSGVGGVETKVALLRLEGAAGLLI